MKRRAKEKLVKTALGRVTLHGWCLLRGGRLRWHCAGIVRELRNSVSRWGGE
ncbi:MAG: hypothetical protein ACXW32_12445 [Limisphaerales bacterium]